MAIIRKPKECNMGYGTYQCGGYSVMIILLNPISISPLCLVVKQPWQKESIKQK